MRVEFHLEALAEFRAAAGYYEQQQTVLGARFANAVEMAIAHGVAANRATGATEADHRPASTDFLNRGLRPTADLQGSKTSTAGN